MEQQQQRDCQPSCLCGRLLNAIGQMVRDHTIQPALLLPGAAVRQGVALCWRCFWQGCVCVYVCVSRTPQATMQWAAVLLQNTSGWVCVVLALAQTLSTFKPVNRRQTAMHTSPGQNCLDLMQQQADRQAGMGCANTEAKARERGNSLVSNSGIKKC